MNLEDEIKDKFANLQKGTASKLKDYDAWIFKYENGIFGVAIPYIGEKVNERFANVTYYSSNITFGEESQSYLILASSLLNLRNEFASICANFVKPGLDYERNRQEIQENPFSWWKKWTKLLGNAVKYSQTHSVIGEMLLVKYLKTQNKEVKWKPTDYSTNDIFSEGEYYEVKSTTSKYQEILTINSQFQLRQPNYLVLCRFEKIKSGTSINDLIDQLENYGIDRSFLNFELEAIGFPEGSLSRQEKYALLEMRMYKVNDSFPGKELNDFLKSYNDPYVGKVTYDIDLKGIPYKNIMGKIYPM